VHLIAGLGNPGRGYRHTRHNAGFMVVDQLAGLTGIKVRGFRYRARTGSGNYRGMKLMLLKPRTYMNLSGKSIKPALKALRLFPENLVVIHDDLDLSVGRIKVKLGGGSGGHKGVQSIIEELGTQDFARIRIGIGKPRDMDPADYVLTPFDEEELSLVKEAVKKGARAALAVCGEGVDRAMNEFNSK